MLLICMAHRGEAQSFIKDLDFELNTEGQLYLNQNQKMALLLTNEGIYETFSKLGFILAKYNISQIINYGIAGALDSSLKQDQVYQIRTSYYHNGHVPKFHSYTSEGSFDCITCDERVLNDELSTKLRCFAQIVDRELWAVAKVAVDHKIPYTSYKLISDYAGSSTQCFDLKAKAKYFSDLMLIHFRALNLTHEEHTSHRSESFSFNASFTMQKRIQSLMDKLNISQDEIEDMYHDLEDKSKTSKENAKTLIYTLENVINPLERIITEKFNHYLSPLTAIGSKINFNPKSDKQSYTIQMEINSQKNIDNLSSALSSISFEKFTQIWNGDIDV